MDKKRARSAHNFMDLTGQVYGRLTVLARGENQGRRTRWLCRCKCGTEKLVRAESLRSGGTVSCGCLRREKIAEVGRASRGRPSEKLIDLVGQEFGLLTVIERAPNTAAGQARWRCRCSCGSIRVVHAAALRNGRSTSCGCLKLTPERRESARVKATRHGHAGQKPSPTYASWKAMKDRCLLPTHVAYIHYGGRGITVCDRWLDFTNFLEDMGERPEGTSLDRRDVDSGYSKENCRWATPKEQANNKRGSKIPFTGTADEAQRVADYLAAYEARRYAA